MDKYLVVFLILVSFTSAVVIFTRRQAIKEIEKTKTNPSADDFEIVE